MQACTRICVRYVIGFVEFLFQINIVQVMPQQKLFYAHASIEKKNANVFHRIALLPNNITFFLLYLSIYLSAFQRFTYVKPTLSIVFFLANLLFPHHSLQHFFYIQFYSISLISCNKLPASVDSSFVHIL